jgi:hypothetical protein
MKYKYIRIGTTKLNKKVYKVKYIKCKIKKILKQDSLIDRFSVCIYIFTKGQ